MKMIRALEINVDDQGYGGVYSLVKNIIAFKPSNIQIDIANIEKFESKDRLEEIKKSGVNVNYIGYDGNKLVKQIVIYKSLKKLLQNENYNCVHIHADTANKLYVSALAARNSGIKNIIVHSHASNVEGKHLFLKRIIHNIFKILLPNVATKYAACSESAKRWMYCKQYWDKTVIINNGIDTSKFKFDQAKRNEIRHEYNFENRLVIGHVGRFSSVKNHKFILDIFVEVLKENPNSSLLLIGEGELLEETKLYAKELDITDKVIFAGTTDKVFDLLECMDVFVMPSLNEGFPMVCIEAEAEGLPIVTSNGVSKSVDIVGGNIVHLDLQDDISVWSRMLLSFAEKERQDCSKIIEASGYGIQNTVNQIMNLYN